ncbi:MAG: hypothetical protein LBR29_11875, partial [Methylobacteriaceae bacterium]|nr:hypothetical protein [Methylobacteriaceae bacterium]
MKRIGLRIKRRLIGFSGCLLTAVWAVTTPAAAQFGVSPNDQLSFKGMWDLVVANIDGEAADKLFSIFILVLIGVLVITILIGIRTRQKAKRFEALRRRTEADDSWRKKRTGLYHTGTTVGPGVPSPVGGAAYGATAMSGAAPFRGREPVADAREALAGAFEGRDEEDEEFEIEELDKTEVKRKPAAPGVIGMLGGMLGRGKQRAVPARKAANGKTKPEEIEDDVDEPQGKPSLTQRLKSAVSHGRNSKAAAKAKPPARPVRRGRSAPVPPVAEEPEEDEYIAPSPRSASRGVPSEWEDEEFENAAQATSRAAADSVPEGMVPHTTSGDDMVPHTSGTVPPQAEAPEWEDEIDWSADRRSVPTEKKSTGRRGRNGADVSKRSADSAKKGKGGASEGGGLLQNVVHAVKDAVGRGEQEVVQQDPVKRKAMSERMKRVLDSGAAGAEVAPVH